MSDRGHDPRMDSLKALYELKKKNPNDSATENKFFNAILAYLLENPTDHWWCTKELEPLVRESMMLFSLPAYDHITQYKNRMNQQLTSCRHCLDAYHNSKCVLRQRCEHYWIFFKICISLPIISLYFVVVMSNCIRPKTLRSSSNN